MKMMTQMILIIHGDGKIRTADSPQAHVFTIELIEFVNI